MKLALPPAAAQEAVGARPFGALEWMVALRYLRSRRWRWAPSAIAGFSLAGISVGVFVLVVGMSVMNGFHIELLNKILGVNGHVFLQGVETPLTDYDAVTKRILAVPGVTLALPMIESAAGVSSPYQQSGALVRGVREADLKRIPGVAEGVRRGTLDGFEGAGGVAIGAKLAQSLAVQIGDMVSLLTARGDATPFGVAPRIKAYPVQAIFQTGVSELDGVFVYMPLDDAQAFFNHDGEATLIEVFVKDPDDMDVMRARIEAAAERPVILTDWRERNKGFFDALKVESSAMFLILSLIIAVAALNIISGLIMLVKDKGRGVAILRTMGATRGAVMRVFLLNGVLMGVIGTACGVVLGLIVARHLESIRQAVNHAFGLNIFDPNFYLLSRIPTVVQRGDVLLVVCLSVGLSLLATLYPSWRAAKLDPVEALRYE